MFFDTHIHSAYSHDSQMPLEQAIARARELDLGMVLTEHIDINYPDPTAFRLDIAGYFRDYRPFRSETVLLGVEIGLGVLECEDNRRIALDHPFDYVLGSIHLVNGVDTYSPEYYRGKSKQIAYGEYLDFMLACVKCCEYIDSLGHIDYICRYAPYPDTEMYYDEYRDKIDAVLKQVAESGKCLELNTRRLGDKATAQALLPIYLRFAELGGQYATVGSDAHNTGNIGKYFATARELLQECGLTPVYFKERRLIPIE